MIGTGVSEAQPHFSGAAERNKHAIRDVLRSYLAPGAEVLEIASGTAQHALHMASTMPDIVWQPSDRDVDEYGLRDAIAGATLENLRPPIVLDVTRFPTFRAEYDAVYSANCIHVMPHENLAHYIAGAAKALKPLGMMMLYGPFNYGGRYTGEGNERFDAFLAERYPGGGIRDFEEVDALARRAGLQLHDDHAMPSDNRFLVWRNTAPVA